jgi:hypothetical protein
MEALSHGLNDSNGFRGVSSTVKLSVSKTELGGSNPSAPARVQDREGVVEESGKVWQQQ